MIKHRAFLIICIVVFSVFILFVACTSGTTAIQKTVPSNIQDSSNSSFSIDSAIKLTAERIDNRLLRGVRLAIVNVSSDSAIFSDYVTEELTMALEEHGNITVVDRNTLHIALARKELNFQMSGDVSDETQQSIGKWLGAQSILSASILDVGDAYRFRTAVIRVETLAREATAAFDIQKDSRINTLLTSATPISYVNDVNPTTSHDYKKRGNKNFWDLRNLGNAIADYTQAIRLNPLDADAWFFRGFAYVYQQQYQNGVDDYTESLRLNPQYFLVYRQRGYAYMMINELEKAASDLTFAAGIDQNDHVTRYYQSLLYMKQKEYRKALEAINVSINMNRSSLYLQVRAEVYFYLEDKQNTMRDLEQALRLDPENFLIQYRLQALREDWLWFWDQIQSVGLDDRLLWQ